MRIWHTNELLLRLDQIFTSGITTITNKELSLWYDAERIGKTVWRDIHTRWTALMTEHKSGVEVPLLVGWGDYRWVFVYGEGLQTNGSWLQDIREKGGVNI